MDVGNLGYFIASGLFSILVLLLITHWRGRLQGGLLLLAVFSCLLWSLSQGLSDFRFNGSSPYPIMFEVIRNVSLYAFLFSLLKPIYASKKKTLLLNGLSSLVYLASLLLLVGSFYIDHNIVIADLYFLVDYKIILIGSLVLSIAGLVLIEQLFRNTRPDNRWAVKYLFTGIGLLFIYDFFLYSDAILFSGIDKNIWSGRGFVAALSVPLLAISAARNPRWSLDIFVSRQLVFHTTTLMGVGGYLLIMASAGYYIKLYGGSWGSVARIVFFFLAFILLFALLFSGDVRAKTKVFISKHFFNYKYDYRDEWLKITKELSRTGIDSDLNDTVINSISKLVESQGGMLWLLDEDKDAYQCVAKTLFPDISIKEEKTGNLATFLNEKNWVINLDEYRENVELYNGLKLPDWLSNLEKAWLVIPMRHLDTLIGFLVLSQPRIKRYINWEDRDLLKTASMQASSYLAFQEASDSLAMSEKFAVFNRLSAFVVHDLKNLIAQLDLVVRNAEKFKHKPEFVEDAFLTVGYASEKMGRLLTQLRQGRFTEQSVNMVNIKEVMDEVIRAHENYMPKPELICRLTDVKIPANHDRFISVVGHIIKNAQEATDDEGYVKVYVSTEDNNVIIKVMDNGYGMDATFIKEKLFHPFITTKGNAGMGVGVYECREFIRALGGEVAVCSSPGQGTEFELVIPGLQNKTNETNAETVVVE